MGRGKKYQPEQVVNLLRQIEVADGESRMPLNHGRLNMTSLGTLKQWIVSRDCFQNMGALTINQPQRKCLS